MRTIIRAALALVAIALVAFLLLGYWAGSRTAVEQSSPPPAGTTGDIDVQKARERGAELGQRAAVAASEVKEAITETSLTAKIKAKMALDDLVKARAIDVTTSGSTVTLRGSVQSAAERDRAVSLARETEGVTKVNDELQVRRVQ
jgi:hyperosmotically inducible protein